MSKITIKGDRMNEMIEYESYAEIIINSPTYGEFRRD